MGRVRPVLREQLASLAFKEEAIETKMVNLYKWLWSEIGGRPWTYILRDAWDNAEFFWIVGLVSLGI
jgi:hypothetical protein